MGHPWITHEFLVLAHAPSTGNLDIYSIDPPMGLPLAAVSLYKSPMLDTWVYSTESRVHHGSLTGFERCSMNPPRVTHWLILIANKYPMGNYGSAMGLP